jgi:hypothetical protein
MQMENFQPHHVKRVWDGITCTHVLPPFQNISFHDFFFKRPAISALEIANAKKGEARLPNDACKGMRLVYLEVTV